MTCYAQNLIIVAWYMVLLGKRGSELDKIYHQRLWIISGALQTSPIASLYGGGNASTRATLCTATLKYHSGLWAIQEHVLLNVLFEHGLEEKYGFLRTCIWPGAFRIRELLDTYQYYAFAVSNNTNGWHSPSGLVMKWPSLLPTKIWGRIRNILRNYERANISFYCWVQITGQKWL